MPPDHARGEFLKEALRARHNEPFERSLGRAIRRLGGAFDEYLAIVSELREYARIHKMGLRAAAHALADQP